jgi:hypothetical protein
MTTPASTQTKLCDAFGTPLEDGDNVIYAFCRASSSIVFCHATVIGRSSKRVRIELNDSRYRGMPAFEDKEPKLVMPHQLVKYVNLPQDT